MKRILFFAVIIFVAIFLFLPVCAPPGYVDYKDVCVFIPRWKLLFENKKKTILYSLNDKKYELLTAKNPNEWQKGLMYYRKLDGMDGMIFIFPDKQIRHFWNKNTFMDLDIYWVSDSKVIGKGYLPSIEKSKNLVIVRSPDKADIVIELQAGK